MKAGNNIPLYKRTHWRVIRNIFTEIGQYEKINFTDYNLNSMTCYVVKGKEMNGNNVTYCTADRKPIWENSETYEIYEAPYKDNLNERFSFAGSFLFLAHNVEHDYWIFGTLSNQINYQETRIKKNLIETIKIRPYGRYTIIPETRNKDGIINKASNGKYISGTQRINSRFDCFDTRRKSFSKLSAQDVAARILDQSRNQKMIIDTRVVKKYKSNRRGK